MALHASRCSSSCQLRQQQLQSHFSVRCPPQHSRRSIACPAYTLKPSAGQEICVNQVKYLVGSGPAADLKLQGANVAAEHAELQQKGKQVFLKALQGESVFDRTYTWIDDAEARANVSYVLASGSTLAFGEQQQSFMVEFEEPSGTNPLVEMMMKGMAAGADVQVQKELSE
uniref:FHA domain-containing protein n=1 Tax=Tetradesmus obliquus TaxID=3088 RepID=A0A383WP24_TETOB|eukprot:jgi/Sobl393_1/13904/SZX79023.1